MLRLLGAAALAAVAPRGAAEEVEVAWSLPGRRLGGGGAPALPEAIDIAFATNGTKFDVRLQRNRAILPKGARHELRYRGGRVEAGPMPASCFYVGEVVGDVWGSASISTCDGHVSGLVLGHGKAVTLEPVGGAAVWPASGPMRLSARSIDDPRFHHKRNNVARFAHGFGGKVNVTPAQRRLTGAATKTVEAFAVNDYKRFTDFGGQSGLADLAKHTVGMMNTVTAIYRKPPAESASFPYTVQVVLVGQQTFVEPDPWNDVVKMVGVETDCESLLNLFNEWGHEQQQGGTSLIKVYDNRVLLSGRDFDGQTVGLAGMSAMCVPAESGSVNMCGKTAEEAAHCAATVAHEMGHNFGMDHDSTGNACKSTGYIMEAIGGNEATTQFSACSASYITKFFSDAYAQNGECLENTPSQVEGDPICGNGFVEEGEDCDCASSDCTRSDACCNGKTCKFKDPSYQCSATAGACCESCKFVAASAGKVCRPATGTCDLPEVCPGGTADCAVDAVVYPGKRCETHGFPGLCSSGRCHSLNATCAVDLNRDFGPGWDLSEPCAQLNDECGHAVCHVKGEGPYECGQGFVVHGKPVRVPDGTPCWFPGFKTGTRTGMCFGGGCHLAHALARAPKCGNGGIDFGEQCDCGSGDDPCCDCATCRLKEGKQCSSLEPCCDQCSFKAAGAVCRAAGGGCDVAEVCSGSSGVCPSDKGKKWGTACTASDGKPSTCFGKICLASLSGQCSAVTAKAFPFGARDYDGVTPSKSSDCKGLVCCQKCGAQAGIWQIDGKEYTDPYLCESCSKSAPYTQFQVGNYTNKIWLEAAEDGTVLADPTKMCVAAEPVAPPSSCASGSFLEDSVGRCLPCDSSCTECSGPSNFDCIGNCKYGQDSRGACAISADQVVFAGTNGVLVATTSGKPQTGTTRASQTAGTTAAGTTAAGRTTAAPASTTRAPEVKFEMTIEAVSFEDLMASPTLLDDFAGAVMTSIATSLGVPLSAVSAEFFAGSVGVEATVVAPAGVTAESIAAKLDDGATTAKLRSSVVAGVSALPNIDSVTTGTISVSEVTSAVTVTFAPGSSPTSAPESVSASSPPAVMHALALLCLCARSALRL